jgi:hypothetical protein
MQTINLDDWLRAKKRTYRIPRLVAQVNFLWLIYASFTSIPYLLIWVFAPGVMVDLLSAMGIDPEELNLESAAANLSSFVFLFLLPAAVIARLNLTAFINLRWLLPLVYAATTLSWIAFGFLAFASVATVALMGVQLVTLADPAMEYFQFDFGSNVDAVMPAMVIGSLLFTLWSLFLLYRLRFQYAKHDDYKTLISSRRNNAARLLRQFAFFSARRITIQIFALTDILLGSGRVLVLSAFGFFALATLFWLLANAAEFGAPFIMSEEMASLPFRLLAEITNGQALNFALFIPLFLLFAVGILRLISWVYADFERILERSKRRQALQAAQLRTIDARSPVLFLRAFSDDNVAAQRTIPIPRWLSGRQLPSQRLEEALARILLGQGPVIALNEPGIELPPLGAARDNISDENWQSIVGDLIVESQLIVLFWAETDGVAWELDKILELGALNKLIVITPPNKNLTPSAVSTTNGRPAFARASGGATPTRLVAYGSDLESFKDIRCSYSDIEAYSEALLLALRSRLAS